MMSSRACTMVDWSRQSKQDSRDITIVDCYRANMRRDTLPVEKQYWTTCGRCTDQGTLKIGCEPYQMVINGLITPSQFYGVEIDHSIYKANSKITRGYNWIHGDLLHSMESAAGKGNYNPGIVFYDSMSYSFTNVSYVNRIMTLISELDITDVLLLVNNIVRGKILQVSPEDVLSPILEDRNTRTVIERYNWSIIQNTYTYRSSGKNKAIRMAVVGFIRTI